VLTLARTMQRLMPRMDRACRPLGFTQHVFDAAPCGTAYVGIAPAEQHEHASANQNRINLCGADGGLSAAGLAQLLVLFPAAGVGRFNVWVSPGPEMDAVRRWLADAGLTRVPWVAYHTLARDAVLAASVATDLTVREVTADTLPSLPDDVMWPDYRRSAGASGYHHFMAFDGARPVASAALYVAEELGYLGMASTAEADRRRGAQQALIAARIETARAVGCRVLVSETLSILTSSLGNLRRAGFTSIYDREVYTNATI
jgi:hypothetical protein